MHVVLPYLFAASKAVPSSISIKHSLKLSSEMKMKSDVVYNRPNQQRQCSDKLFVYRRQFSIFRMLAIRCEPAEEEKDYAALIYHESLRRKAEAAAAGKKNSFASNNGDIRRTSTQISYSMTRHVLLV